MILQNLHTHTTFCDGNNTAEEMVQSAIRLGMNSLGFSGHSPVDWSDENWASLDVPAYRAEVLRLRSAYAGQLDIFLGIEQDLDSPPRDPKLSYDYAIGSVHNVWVDGVCLCVDNTAQIMLDAIHRCFGGDPYAYTRTYFRRMAEVAAATGCQIVGHFDLVTKFNEGGRYFDEEHPRYLSAALEALDALSGRDLIFEINTGAISRGYRTVPYPSPTLLRAIREKGNRICITSDSHSVGTLLCAFDQARELARACGFRETWALTERGFIPQQL